MNVIKKLILCLMLCVLTSMGATAQKSVVKTNALYDLTATLNAGIEIGLSPRWTLDISANFNPWKFSKRDSEALAENQDGARRRWKHWLIQPEFRYWFCQRFSGDFIGFHAIGGQYNVGGIGPFTCTKERRYQGWGVGGGIAYGHSWIISRHWNIEAELGIGYIYSRNDKFRCLGCGKKIDEDRSRNYFGPTKAAINLVYVF